eukprot:scaffold73821_cov26-Prasinocladus_malaysianus.AAC.1
MKYQDVTDAMSEIHPCQIGHNDMLTVECYALLQPIQKLFEVDPPDEPTSEEIAAAREAKVASQKAKQVAVHLLWKGPCQA